MLLEVAQLQIQIIIYLAIGFFCKFKKLIDEGIRTKIIKFVLTIPLPCMIFESFNKDFGTDIFRNCGIGFLIAVIIQGLSFLLGLFLFRKNDPKKRSVLRYGLSFSNCGFSGLPLCQEMYGAAGGILGSFVMIPQRILMWSVGISYFRKEKTKKSFMSVVLHPAMIGIYLGIIRLLTGVKIPDFINTPITKIGNITTPLAIVLIGSILADTKLSSLLKGMLEADTWIMISFRHILLPTAAWGVAKLFHADTVTLGVSITLTGMPIASLTAAVANEQGGDSKYASVCVFLSTVISLITVPLLTLLQT